MLTSPSSKSLVASLALVGLIIPLATMGSFGRASALGMMGGGLPATPPITPPDSSPTPSPSASPKPESDPIIITSTLGEVKVGQLYSGEVSAIDANVSDTLSMTITGLPDGLMYNDCETSTTSDYKIVTCDVEGTPTQAKMYNVRVTATDDQGGSDQEKLHLKVVKK